MRAGDLTLVLREVKVAELLIGWWACLGVTAAWSRFLFNA